MQLSTVRRITSAHAAPLVALTHFPKPSRVARPVSSAEAVRIDVSIFAVSFQRVLLRTASDRAIHYTEQGHNDAKQKP
jgi:hypothetical protein